MRSTLALLLLFGAAIGVYADECKLYELPKDKKCTKVINWKVHNNEQATATCLEYFPTTFVKGKKLDAGKIECIVQAAYQCVEPNTFLMFDKCYSFPKTSDGLNYEKGTIGDYTGPNKKCKGGKLSVFYSYAHAKFLGMKAKGLGIEKLWIGITRDGKTIEKPETTMHSELWKLVEGDYWDVDGSGKEILTTIPDLKIFPEAAKYFFMRIRNDEFNNRFQGSFERASDKIKATFACEFEAKFTAHQKWYCDKMGSLGLGLDTVYDEADVVNGDKSRCLYVSANSYTWDGTYADTKNIKGCQEKPSLLHSAGLDDGAGNSGAYKFNHKGKLRLAGYMVERSEGSYAGLNEVTKQTVRGMFVQDKCTGSASSAQKKYLIQKWRYLDHHGKILMASSSKVSWDYQYPLNECSDFPGISSTLGLKDGKLIDMPTELRAQAVCSLTFFQECENKKPCGGKVECRNEKTFQTNVNPDYQGFFTCRCPGPSVEEHQQFVMSKSLAPTDRPYITHFGNDGKITCEWNPTLNAYCAWARFYQSSQEWSAPLKTNEVENIFDGRFNRQYHNDLLDQVVVRDGCRLSVRSAATFWERDFALPNFDLITNAGFGTHEIPVVSRKTLVGGFEDLGASSVECHC